MAELTPMMRQYHTTKERYPDCLLFFRLGDFYEMFWEDAKLASRELDLTLTTRDRNKPEEERTPMCGVPYHSVDAYLARLVAKGYKVAICEQTEDPALAKGLVGREVTRVVTPGTAISSAMLDETRNNFLCALWGEEQAAGLCFCDLSTGQVFATSFAGADWPSRALGELGRFSPREVLFSPRAAQVPTCQEYAATHPDCRCDTLEETCFDLAAAQPMVTRQFSQGIDGLAQGDDAPIRAAGALLHYLYETQKTDLGHLTALRCYASSAFLELDPTACRNLELTETLRGGEKRGSLLGVLDRTRTPMGGRLLRSWLHQPLLSPAAINRRLDGVDALVRDPVTREELVHTLRAVPDLERLMGRIVYGTAGGRELVSLASGLGLLTGLRALLAPLSPPLLRTLAQELDDLPDLRALLSAALVDEPPLSVREGGFIRPGFDQEADRLRGLFTGGKGAMAAIEARERARTGIKNLKVSYNKVFGYYLEVSKSNYAQVPPDYIRKQTLVNCERYITQELKELEHEVLSAQEKLAALEYQLFCTLRDAAAALAAVVQRSAAAAAQVDVLCSFAAVSAAHGYCRPEIDLSDRIAVTEGRHPVVEQMLKNSLFVPNDVTLDCDSDRLAIITGPNMAGKSTYMRQVALTVVMAQIGCFVPAKTAALGVVDRIFTRIGASDDLAAGQSTFMVEMSEVARLLRGATTKSLLILDEIGRGTSTYDGMAIARAVLEWCADRRRLGCKTLFATHYHELTCLEGLLPGVKNYNIAAKKKGGEVVFLRKIVRGSADDSYGVEVAALAGVPQPVVTRAKEILHELEQAGRTPCALTPPPREEGQLALGDLAAQQVAEVLRTTAVETLTPIEALNLLWQLKQQL